MFEGARVRYLKKKLSKKLSLFTFLVCGDIFFYGMLIVYISYTDKWEVRVLCGILPMNIILEKIENPSEFFDFL